MNTFGRLFRISILGESHGECVGVLVDGCPAGQPLSEKDLLADLGRRKSGRQGTTARMEEDVPLIKGGVFNGKTTGAPVLILFENKDTDPGAYERIKDTPRPSHADFVAFCKYGGYNDYRGGGAFSGRLTAGLVAAGVIAKMLIHPIEIEANLTEVGGSDDIEGAVRSAIENRDTVGGIVECRAKGLPVGLGEPFFDSLESLLSHIVFSVPGIKGIEFGAGFAASKMAGSAYNDIILDIGGATKTNNAGGINGGITNGNELLFRVAVKPASGIQGKQQTVDLKTGKPAELVIGGRHDTCIALRVPVIMEAVAAIVLADLMSIGRMMPAIVR
ncbi:MAG TPA: chorismate synthase [Syntrophorhabdaceae bacterium]|nr:chorismate synthase [Syntrophorhabdaceae bacterium]